MAVFLPVLFLEGIAAQLFRDMALTVSFSLIASLAVSLTLIPMLAALFGGAGRRRRRAVASWGVAAAGRCGPRVLPLRVSSVPAGARVELRWLMLDVVLRLVSPCYSRPLTWLFDRTLAFDHAPIRPILRGALRTRWWWSP